MSTLKYILISVLLLNCLACVDSSSHNELKIKNKSRKMNYRLIRDKLYVDKEGNLYLRTVDVSSADSDDSEKNKKLTIYRWLDVVYCDTCRIVTSTETGVTKLKDFIDTASFSLKYTDEKQGGDFYKDKNNVYFHKWMADGGTIALID